MGDPAGIGPEICARLLNDQETSETCIPIIFGVFDVIMRYASQLDIDLSHVQKTESETDLSSVTQPTIVDFGMKHLGDLKLGQVAAEAGEAAFRFIDAAIEAHLGQEIQAIATGPINKLSLHAAGHNYPGHTEIFAEKTNVSNYCMMQYSEEITCSFATTHVGYADVVSLITTQRILDVILLTSKALQLINGKNPKLIVCGLNPHAGEDGLFGNQEEERIIIPAIEQALSQGVDVSGPFPPDTCFIPSRRKSTDGFICMYHDQGHIPLKALAFEKAVNTTLGLPIIRTSVDHGTAFDIVGKNCADWSSLREAVRLAVKLAG